LETVRGFYRGGWYADVYTENIEVNAGRATIPKRAGLGTALREELLASPAVQVRTSRKG
jgi:L-alanine-DL-glutamate epimerase-like enolase superfamily enzyme